MRVSASTVGCTAQGMAVCAIAVSRATQRMAVCAIAVGGEVVAVRASIGLKLNGFISRVLSNSKCVVTTATRGQRLKTISKAT